jgi:hypothetical protein
MPGLALPIAGTGATETRASRIEKPAVVAGRSSMSPALLTTGSLSKSGAQNGTRQDTYTDGARIASGIVFDRRPTAAGASRVVV